MNLPHQIAKHIRDVHFGGNWTTSNLKDQLDSVTWAQAIAEIGDLNTIAKLVFHIDYFVAGIIPVFQGGALELHDKYSFDVPEITSEGDWQQLVTKTLEDAETLAALVERLPEGAMDEPLAKAEYGTNHRNLMGIIEHTHYHLGQIALIKKLVAASRS